jgi:anti-sigma regulatory factor (Ser/Thr protein kinase)
MLRNLGIRGQVLAALALPVLVLMLVGGLLIRHAATERAGAGETLELTQASSALGGLVDGLAAERLASVDRLEHRRGGTTALKTARTAVDLGLSDLRARIASPRLTDDAAVRAVLQRSVQAHLTLGALRSGVDGGKLGPGDVAGRYASIIAADLSASGDLAVTGLSGEPAQAVTSSGLLRTASEAAAQEQLTGLEILRAGRATSEQQRALGAAVERQNAMLARFAAQDPAALRPVLTGRAAGQLDDARAALQRAGTTGRPALSTADWTTTTAARTAALAALGDRIGAGTVTTATAAAADARTRLILTAAGVGLVVLLSLLLGLAVGRRISASMRRLTEATARVRDELPRLVRSVRPDDEPDPREAEVAITGRDEVSRLAAALVDVHHVVLDVARDQARLRASVNDMFVNVARRNQVLLSRQLAIVDQLERVEGDGDVLEDLYRIDHLGTRMRRNAESMLVLAGIDSGRRLREPMALSDVVRTATSEIEHYPRVALALTTDPAVAAHLALTVAHLLAELLDNACIFSDPSTTVVVSATATPDGVRVVITDEGRGMTDDELAEAQARIEEPPSTEALGSRRLGFFVVGLLARRLDVEVALRPGAEGHGLVALVDLPASFFAPAPTTHAPTAPPAQVPRLLPVAVGAAPAPFVPSAPPTSPSADEPAVRLLPYDEQPDAEPAAPVSYAGSYGTTPGSDAGSAPDAYADSYADSYAAPYADSYADFEPGSGASFGADAVSAPDPSMDSDPGSREPAAAGPPGEQALSVGEPYDEPGAGESAPEDTVFGPEFAYDPDYEPELVDGYTYRPVPDPAVPYAEPAYSGPAFTEPHYAAPDYAEPDYAAPDYAAPDYAEPAYAEPEYGERANAVDRADEAHAAPSAGHELDAEAPSGEPAAEANPAPVVPADPPDQSIPFPEVLGPNTIDVLPQRVSIRTALLRGRRRPPRGGEAVDDTPVSPPPTGSGRDNFAELTDPQVEEVDYEGIPAQRAPQDDDAPLPDPLLPWSGEDR